MTAYLQMGHHSQNLLNENDLAQYKGAVLSPVNEDENCIQAQINAHQGEGFEMIFDSQLYYPNAERGRLPEWSYFPSDVESADRTSLRWWRRIITGLKQTALRIHPQAICSPALVPQVYNDNYYTLNQQVAEIMKDRFTNTGIDILQTLIVNLTDITEETRPAEIASIATSGPLDRVFLVLKSDTEPRRELSDT